MVENVLILGGAGFIGSHTVDRLVAEGHHVRILDALVPPVHIDGQSPAHLNPAAEFVRGDVGDAAILDAVLEGVDVVFHLAAYQDYRPDLSRFFDVNVRSTALLYERIVANRSPLRKVIVASSQFVQGEGLYRASDGTVISPDFRTRESLQRGDWNFRDETGEILTPISTPASHAAPTNAYGLSKRAQEEAAIVFGRRYGIPTTVLRYSIVQGERQSRHNTYSGVCRIFSLHLLNGLVPTIFEDGEQLRDFVNVHDVVDANLCAMRDLRTDGRVFAVGGERPMSINSFAAVVAKIVEAPIPEAPTPPAFRFGDARHCVSDSSPLRDLGWYPTRSVEDSVRSYVDWAQSERDDLRAQLRATITELRSTGVVASTVERDSEGTTADDPEFWHGIWRDGRLGFDQPSPNRFLVEELPARGLDEGGRVFVPLCGKSIDMGWIAEQGYRVLGVEVDEGAVRRFFAERDDKPTITTESWGARYSAGSIEILVADIFDLSSRDVGPIDLWYDRAALIALPAPTRRWYLAHVFDLIGPICPGLLVTMLHDGPDGSGPPFSVESDEVIDLSGSRWNPTELRRRKGGRKGRTIYSTLWEMEPISTINRQIL